MTKLDFIFQLHKKLANLPQNEVEERLTFYIEMIEDRMEEGLLEEDAVSAVGTVDEIAAQIVKELSPTLPQQVHKSRRSAGEILLLILGSPIWLSLMISAFAVVLSLYISLWAIIISLWAVFGGLAASAFGAIAGGGYLALGGFPAVGIFLIATGLVCAGLSIFLFFGCKYATFGAVWLTKLPFTKRRKHNVEN